MNDAAEFVKIMETQLQELIFESQIPCNEDWFLQFVEFDTEDDFLCKYSYQKISEKYTIKTIEIDTEDYFDFYDHYYLPVEVEYPDKTTALVNTVLIEKNVTKSFFSVQHPQMEFGNHKFSALIRFFMQL